MKIQGNEGNMMRISLDFKCMFLDWVDSGLRLCVRVKDSNECGRLGRRCFWKIVVLCCWSLFEEKIKDIISRNIKENLLCAIC